MDDLYADVIGHQSVIELVRDDAQQPADAYLFIGPSGVGKASVALRFAASIIGAGDDAVALRVLRGAHPDLVRIEPDGRSSITVDQARSVVSAASLAPFEADRKVFLFEEAGLMNDEAANALLKTLEEASATTTFILVAESEFDLPDTIGSRCRTVVFGRVPDEEVVATLVGRGVDTDLAEQVSRIAGGRPGLAQALVTQPAVAGFRKAWLDVPERVSEHPGRAFVLADQLGGAADPLLVALKERQSNEVRQFESEGGDARHLKDRHDREIKRAATALHVSGLEMLASFYRDAAAAQYGAPLRNPDLPPSALTRLTPARAVANAKRVLDAIDAIDANQRPTLAFAALFTELGAG